MDLVSPTLSYISEILPIQYFGYLMGYTHEDILAALQISHRIPASFERT